MGRWRTIRNGPASLEDAEFKPIPGIPDSRRVTIDLKNGFEVSVAGALGLPNEGDGVSTWAVIVDSMSGSRSVFKQQTTDQAKAIISEYAAKPASDNYLRRFDPAALEARISERRATEEAARKKREDEAYARLNTPMFRRWFGKSKVVDKQGRPLKVYHGSNKAGFHFFDMSGVRDVGMFFTDDLSMAQSYAKSGDLVEVPYFRTMKDLFSSGFSGAKDYPLDVTKNPDGSYRVEFDGYRVGDYAKGESKRMLADINAQTRETSGVYEAYLRIENPYEVDARGAVWDSIVLSDEEDEDDEEEEDDDDYDDDYDYNRGRLYRTRDLAEMAYDMGRDGLIIRDVQDPGGHGQGGESGDVYVVFSSDQIKSATWNTGAYSRKTDDIRLNPSRRRRSP
jgi:hypothetical protein